MGKATRVAYGETLTELGAEDERIVVLDADLSKSTQSAIFGRRFPERFFNFGIAEANMMSAAAGLASCGKIPFASSFASFLIPKSYDQMRVSVAISRLNVKLVGSHGGVTPGHDGPSQMAIEDVALVSAIPGSTVLVPADEVAARACTRIAYRHHGLVYMRTGRPRAPMVYGEGGPCSSTGDKFERGRARLLREGDDITVIANGFLVIEALEAAQECAKEGIAVRVLDMFCVKPVDEEAVEQAARETRGIVTAEEHQIHGGMGSQVARVVARTHPVPMEFVAIDDTFAESGHPDELIDCYGLSTRHITAAVRRLIDRE